uniref:Uncharacterized protein n=2 Tax=unclassified Candidatus Kentrum TaxID=2643149 RepID=A0A451AVC1_9GAMM|nr:MAG: Protein of unknown function (DUF1488) [Candidatus Kentron sp. LPFa]VFK24208.1 MAG: Protein of unknown function (DUF1488) [Candidatus Kentron sp. LPFa]VFK61807.1 MAG: Protein of unknown function (DUF1488) [Candidatus Kentron sp. UNK]VFK70001.1 MAG: Protein of unknown function (DUF1488) [Candidatus Kentron sp. UNK]
MHLTRHRTLPSNKTEILFPLLESWNPMTKVATIAAEVNRKRVLCRISIEVLQEKWGASEEEPMRTVEENRAALQTAARKIIKEEAYEEDGSIVIRSEDIP